MLKRNNLGHRLISLELIASVFTTEKNFADNITSLRLLRLVFNPLFSFAALPSIITEYLHSSFICETLNYHDLCSYFYDAIYTTALYQAKHLPASLTETYTN